MQERKEEEMGTVEKREAARRFQQHPPAALPVLVLSSGVKRTLKPCKELQVTLPLSEP